MSTRSTIWYQEETPETIGLHLHREMMDDDSQPHLQITCGPFVCVVRLPNELIQKLAIAAQRLEPAKGVE